ncbi:hypothetical protein CGRA01v4_08310 [Colletotrichum graminicola]|nr:hypothetical protein CGRA01v4_08310 [Colletotrichum graminicola]
MSSQSERMTLASVGLMPSCHCVTVLPWLDDAVMESSQPTTRHRASDYRHLPSP